MPAPKHTPEQQLQLILDAAATCIEQSSLLDFTMSAISKEAGLSMGSVYKHIQSKEDVLVALATRMYRNLHTTFAKVMALKVPFPTHYVALQLIAPERVCLYAFEDQLETLVANEAILQRASTHWVTQMVAADEAVEQLCRSSLLKAVEDGALQVGPGELSRVAEEVMVGSWSLHVGFIHVARQRHARKLVSEGVDMPFPLQPSDSIIAVHKNMLNSYPWQQPVTDQQIRQVCQLLKDHKLR